MSCPHCGATVAAGDAFCEACGGDVASIGAAAGATADSGSAGPGPTGSVPTDPTDPTGPIDGPAAMSAPTEQPRTHLLSPRAADEATQIAAGAAWMGADTSLPCTACGADVATDGFCTVCGQRARTRREHWTETHADTLGAVCDKGISHARNEDAMATSISDAGVAVLVVCDGVTTAPESDRASLAASVAAAEVLAAAPATTGSPATRISAWEPVLTTACRVANAEAVGVARALGDPPEPPSCTFVAAVVDADLIAVAWCGDSRAYWLPDPELATDPALAPGQRAGEQLTADHSLGTEMIRAGKTREEAEADPTCHTITRWLGADSYDPTPEFRALVVDRPGWLMVCSDGLWNYASSPTELSDLVARAIGDGATTPTAIAESLAAFANQRGGHDNITVALARCRPALP